MRRVTALAALAAGVVALAPVSPASACDPAYDPSCKPQPCWTVDHYWTVVQSVLADPPSRPIC